VIIWPSWGIGLYLIARYFYLFNYDEKYSNEAINLSRGMLITFACSVSTVLKNIPAQTELPPNALSQDHVGTLFSQRFPRHLEIHGWKPWRSSDSLSSECTSIQEMSQGCIPPKIYTEGWNDIVLSLSHPSTTTTHTHTHKLQGGFSQRKYGMAVQFEFQIMNNFYVSVSQILYQKITYCLSETQI